MKLLTLSLLAATLLAGDWEALRLVAPDHKVEVTRTDGTRIHGRFARASNDAIVLRSDSGEQAVGRAEVRAVRVSAPSRRVRNGLIWTAVGAGAGGALGFAVCPGCGNEGAGYKYSGPGFAAGAAIGALGFLSSPYKVVYRSK